MLLDMVQSNNDEERLARVEHIIEKLQRQSAKTSREPSRKG